ncbi:MFS family permease [Nakamurella sp. UYEF19]
MALSLAGIGGLAGSLVAARLGRRFGTGWTIVGCGAVTPLAYVLMASAHGGTLAWLLLGAGQFVLGVCMGAENSNDMGYRQTITPDHLQGRMNATIRSINRAMFVISAPLGGLLADAIGYRTALWIVAGGMAAVGLARALSPFRRARIEDHLPTA